MSTLRTNAIGKRFFSGLVVALAMASTLVGPAVVAQGTPSQGLLDDITNSAQQTGTGSGITKNAEYQDIRITAANIIKEAMTLLGFLTVLLILYAGFLWMTAAGNEEKVATAKKILTNAVIGLVIIMCAYAIAYFVISRLTLASSSAAGLQQPY